jgi:outer membrane protein OmpA-like peptidoglycan-associated protein
MRSSFRIFLAAAALAGAPALAHAQWYVGADAGVNFTESSKVRSNGSNFDTGFDVGPAVLGQVGYSFGAFKLEEEFGWRQNSVDKVNGTSGKGDATSYSLMTNALYDFMPNSTWHPFVGAGIGAARVEANNVQTSSGSAYSGHDWQFAYQAMGGLGYDLTNNWALKGQYRYFSTLDPSVNVNGSKVDADYHNHEILIGFTYKFAAPAPAPVPVATPAPALAPAPAPAPKPQLQKNYIVFFDWNKADITPEAAKIIQQAAAAAKTGAAPRLDLTGHTDRSGSDSYNQALSVKRGNQVKAQLVKLGIPADQISVLGKGESDPLVATPDGVREPQNRRVEIVLP